VKAMTIVSLAFSIVAFVISVMAYRSAREQASIAVNVREEALIRHFKPLFDPIYADFKIDLPATRHPTKVEDLVDPLIQMFDSISGSTSGTRKPTTVP
jgi:hypothetical protein